MSTFAASRTWIYSIALFLFALILVWCLNGDFFAVGLDEGIYLQGGERLAKGQHLYVDVFAFVGPVCYWVQAGLFQAFGNKLQALRLSTAMGIALIVPFLYLLGRRIAGNGLGVVAALLWMGIVLDLPNRMEVNHRWVSMGWFSLSASLVLVCGELGSIWMVLSGVFAGLAIFSTPSFGATALVLGFYLWITQRRSAVCYFAGLASAGFCLLGALWWRGELSGLIEGLRWTASHYWDANRFPFGRLPRQAIPRYFLQVNLGAIVIPLALAAAACFWYWKRESQVLLPIVLCLSLLVTAYPKCDGYSLFFIAGPFLVVLLGVLYSVLSTRLRPLFEGVVVFVFLFLLLGAWGLREGLTIVETRAGVLRADPVSALELERLEKEIPSGATVFVYPYLSGLYSILDVRNPSRYSYLQPGMMGSDDEDRVLQDLQRQPPQFVFWQPFPDEDVLRLWPSSNPSKHRFRRLENWIRAEYEPGQEFTQSQLRGQVWRIQARIR